MVALTATDTKTLMKHTVKELQAELRKHALEIVGTKAVLVQRLQTHLKAAEVEEQSPPPAADASSEAAAPSDAPVASEHESAATADAADDDSVAAADLQCVTTTADAAKKGERSDDASARPASPAAPDTIVTAADDAQDDVHRDVNTHDDISAATSDSQDAQAHSPEPLSESEPTPEPTVTTLRIDNFRRPFTLNAVKSLVQEVGDFVEDNGFWMNSIKTHCYVSYASQDVATKTCERLDGKVWPPVSGIALSAAFSETTAMDVHAHGEPARAGLKRKASGDLAPPSQRRREQPPVSIDATFLKTETKPVLYYLPWTDEQVKQRKEQQARGQTVHDASERDVVSSQRTYPRVHRRGGGKKKKGARGGYRHVRRL